MGKVTESIYDSQSLIILLADVQHIEKHVSGSLVVVTKHTRWDAERGMWANSIFVPAEEAAAFISAWREYRHELEADTLADLAPSNPQE